MLWFFDKLLKGESPADRFITVNKQAKLLHKKEQEIYKKTKEFEKKYSLIASFDFLLYDFQVYCEFIEKYKENFELKYNGNFYDLLDNLALVKRFLEIWYYLSAWIYLRKAFEERIDMMSLKKYGNNKKDNLWYIIELKKPNEWPMTFEKDEVYKIYSYLSEKYAHHHQKIENIEFDGNWYLKMKSLSIILIVTICSITLQMIDSDKVEEYRGNKIDKPGEEYEYYAYYVRLVTWNSGANWFINSLENSGIQDFEFKEQKWLNLEKWIKHSDEIK